MIDRVIQIYYFFTDVDFSCSITHEKGIEFSGCNYGFVYFFSLQFYQYFLYVSWDFIISTQKFMIFRPYWSIDLFIIVKWPCLSPVTSWDLKSGLSAINIADSLFFWLVFAKNLFFYCFTLKLFVSVYLKEVFL